MFYDFNIQKYFTNNQYLIAMVHYARTSQNLLKKDIYQATNLAPATMYRAEATDFIDHKDQLITIANYLGLDTEVSESFVDLINRNFNLLYTYAYFNDLEKMEYYYNNLMFQASRCEKNILLSIILFAKVVFYVHSPKRVEVAEIGKFIDQLTFFQGEMLDVFEFLLKNYSYNYHALNHDSEKSLQYAKEVYLQSYAFVKLVPFVLFQMSLNYYLINDYANSIFYSLEALPKLEKDLNYERALNGHLNIAICFERLNNIIQSREILDKIFLHLIVKHSPRIEFLAKLTLANCFVSDHEYHQAIQIFKELEMTREYKGENSLMILYCHYKLKDKLTFATLAQNLIDEYHNDRFYEGYYHMVLLFKEIVKGNKKQIFKIFTESEAYFIPYKDSKIVDLLYMELRAKKIIPTNNFG